MWGVPVMHPAFTFRQPMQLGPLQAHVAGFVARLVEGFDPDPLLLCNPSAARFKWFIDLCVQRHQPIAIDVETKPPANGGMHLALLPGFAALREVGVGADLTVKGKRDGQPYTFKGVGLSWEWPLPHDVWQLYKRILADPSIPKVLCNGRAFDLPLLRRYGCTLAGDFDDIKQGRRALSSTARVGLGAQAAIYLKCPPWKSKDLVSENDIKGYVDGRKVKKRRRLRYNAEDCVRTAQIRSKHQSEFTSEDPLDAPRRAALYQQQLRLAQAASDMALNGMPVDEQHRKKLSRQLLSLARERAHNLVKVLKPYCKVIVVPDEEKGDKYRGQGLRVTMTGGINENDLRALLYDECRTKGIGCFGLHVPMSEYSRTETELAAVNRNALLYLMAQDYVPDEVKKVIRIMWTVDAPLKARSTYVESDKVLDAIGPDGRVHPSINSDGAETGRWTCSDPNLFNLSETKKEEDGSVQGDLPNIRDMYLAPKGYVFINRDFSALELEVELDVTGDVLLRKLLRAIDPITGKPDAHSARVREWFGLAADAPVPKNIRRQGKVVGFSSQYGGGMDTVFIKVLEQVPEALWDDVYELWLTFRTKHTGIVKWWGDSITFAETHGYSETAIMRRRIYYPPGIPLKPTETSNYRVQGTAADIANSSMVGVNEADAKNRICAKLKRYFPRAWLAMHTYDSFTVCGPEGQAKAINDMLEECMSGPWNAGAGPRLFPSDGKIGRRWGEV